MEIWLVKGKNCVGNYFKVKLLECNKYVVFNGLKINWIYYQGSDEIFLFLVFCISRIFIRMQHFVGAILLHFYSGDFFTRAA